MNDRTHDSVARRAVADRPSGQALCVPAYRLYMLCILVSFVGSTGHIVAVAWLLLQESGASWSVPALFLISAVPGFVLAPVVGRLVDRVDKRLLLVWVDAFSALLVTALAILYWTGSLHRWHLYVVEFVLAFGGAAFFVATRAYVREIVPTSMLLAANGTTAVVYQVGNTLGALLGGFCVSSVSPGVALVANSVSFLLSLSGLLRMGGFRFRSRVASAAPVLARGMLTDFAAAVRYVRASTELHTFLMVLIVLLGVQRFLLGELAPFVRDALHADAAGYGLIQASFTIGCMIGGLTLPWVTHKLRRRLFLGIGPVAFLVLVLVFSLTSSVSMAIPAYLIVGASVQIWALIQTVVQERTDDKFEGRVLALIGLLQSAAFVAVFILSTALTAVVNIRNVYLIVVAVALLLVIGPMVRLTQSRAQTPRPRPPADDRRDGLLNSGPLDRC